MLPSWFRFESNSAPRTENSLSAFGFRQINVEIIWNLTFQPNHNNVTHVNVNQLKLKIFSVHHSQRSGADLRNCWSHFISRLWIVYIYHCSSICLHGVRCVVWWDKVVTVQMVDWCVTYINLYVVLPLKAISNAVDVISSKTKLSPVSPSVFSCPIMSAYVYGCNGICTCVRSKSVLCMFYCCSSFCQ